MDETAFTEHLIRVVSLTEAYLTLVSSPEHLRPGRDSHDQVERRRSEIRIRDEEITDAINRAVEARKDLLAYVLQKPPQQNQDNILRIAKQLHDNETFTSREKLSIEYETSFLGVNILTGECFDPKVLSYMRDPDQRSATYVVGGEFPGDHIIKTHLIESMSEFEKPRRIYSDDKYCRESDLKDYIWCRPEIFDELEDEVAEFMEGKQRILEVGFLHQRIYDLIMKIDPSIEYHGVDISIPAVQIARRKGITAFNANCWYAIPYKDNHFDGIVCSTVKAAGLHPNPEMERIVKDKTNILNIDLQ